MAKATAICTCRKCGQKFEKVNRYCHSRKEADDWERWAEDTYDLCGKCWYQEQKEEEQKKDLYVDIRFNTSYIMSNDDGDCELAFVFGGNSYPKKDEIKAIGGVWTDNYPTEGAFKSLFGASFTPKRWVLFCALDELNETVKKVEDIGAKINNVPTNMDIAVYEDINRRKRQQKEEVKKKIEQEKEEKQKEKQKLLDELGPIPPWPDDIAEKWPDGTTWNGKIYGKEGYYNVYFSGKNVRITNEQKEEMEKTSELRDEWKKKKKEIEDKFK